MTRARRRAAAAAGGRPPLHEREARLEARRRQLLDAAMAAIDAVGPDVTMTRMAAEAGVTKPVLYRYFGDRRGLYDAVAATFAAALLADLRAALRGDGTPRQLLEGVIGAYLAHVESRPGLYRFLTERLPAETPGGRAAVTGFVHQVASEVAGVLAERLAPAGVTPERADLLAFGITGMVQLAGERWLATGRLPRAAVVDQLAAVLWDGLAGIGGAGGSGVQEGE